MFLRSLHFASSQRESFLPSPYRMLIALCLLAASISLIANSGLDQEIGKRDFTEYWAAGQQLIHGENPYDALAIGRLERLAGADRDQPQVSFSPPFAFVWDLPLGFMGSKTGANLWILVTALCLTASVRILRDMYRTSNSRIHLLGYLFAPVLACVMVGQLDMFLLLGLVLFLRFHTVRPFWAGAALLPFSMKPHLLLPFLFVLLLWCFSKKNSRVLLGAGGALFVASLFVLCVDTQAWSQYQRMLQTIQPTSLFVPTWSMIFRLVVNPTSVWLQFIPEAVGCSWALWYFWTRRNEWRWKDHGLLLILVSVLCAPYARFFDEGILLPAILASLYRAENAGKSLAPFGLIAVISLFEILLRTELSSVFYLWTVPAWLAWYLYAIRNNGKTVEDTGDLVPELS